MSRKHLKQKIREMRTERDRAHDNLVAAENRISQLEWLILAWADASDDMRAVDIRDPWPEVRRAYSARQSLRQAVGR